jgi:hypothetical protein
MRRLLTPRWSPRRRGMRRRWGRRRGAPPIARSSGVAETTSPLKALQDRGAGKPSFPALARSGLAWRPGWPVARRASGWGCLPIPTNCTPISGDAAQTQTDAEIPTAAPMAIWSEKGRGSTIGGRCSFTAVNLQTTRTARRIACATGATRITRVRGLGRDPKSGPRRSRCRSICGSAHRSARSPRVTPARRPNASSRRDARSAFRCRPS